MKNVVAIWAMNYDSEEELKAFVEISYDEDEEAQPSGFMTSIGTSRLDIDEPTECAASVRADFKYLFPFFPLEDFLLPALSLCPGTTAAQEHK
jgi:hypothetical protein